MVEVYYRVHLILNNYPQILEFSNDRTLFPVLGVPFIVVYSVFEPFYLEVIPLL